MWLTTPLPSARPGLCAAAATAAADVLSHDALLRCAPPWEGEGAACGVGATTILPSSFGPIFASETFRCFLAVYNCGMHNAAQVAVHVELESATATRRTLLDTRSDTRPALAPRECATHVIAAHLPETGLHVLKCSATYIDSSRQQRTFRQIYRFNVLAPLEPAVSVIPLGVHTAPNRAKGRARFLVELRLLNATSSPIYVNKAHLRAYPHYEVSPLAAKHVDADDASRSADFPAAEPLHKVALPVARRASVAAGDSQSFLFLVSRLAVDADDASKSVNSTPRAAGGTPERSVDVEKGPPDAVRARMLALRAARADGGGSANSSTRRRREIGTLSVSWRSGLGEIGRMDAASVAYEPRRKHSDVELTIVAVPASIRVQHPFSARCCVRNNSSNPLRLYLQVRRDLVGEIVPLGVSGLALKELQPGKSTECTLTLLPLRSGQHAISGVRVFDMVSRKSYSAEPPVVSVL